LSNTSSSEELLKQKGEAVNVKILKMQGNHSSPNKINIYTQENQLTGTDSAQL
jgi:hypothetical protein